MTIELGRFNAAGNKTHYWTLSFEPLAVYVLST
jgi:hypothetical protein